MKISLLLAVFVLASCVVRIHMRKEVGFDNKIQLLKLTSFRILSKKTGLFDILNDVSKSHTVFAPTDDAFKKVPSSVLDNTTRLTELLEYHVHKGSFETSQIVNDMLLKTLLGGRKKIRFNIYNGDIYCSCKRLGDQMDQTYNNGILDTMDEVMIPPEGQIIDCISSPSFTTLQKYINKARLERFFTKPMTFLAPNNDAFQSLAADVKEKLDNDFEFLTKVLMYHSFPATYCAAGFRDGEMVDTYEKDPITVDIKGGKIIFNKGSVIVQKDTMAYNGVVHVIDHVLLPPSSVDSNGHTEEL